MDGPPVTGVAHPGVFAIFKEVKVMSMRVPISAEELEIKVSESDGIDGRSPSRRLGRHQRSPVVRTVRATVTPAVSPAWSLNLSQLESMDSTGLSVVVAEHKRTTNDGGRAADPVIPIGGSYACSNSAASCPTSSSIPACPSERPHLGPLRAPSRGIPADAEFSSYPCSKGCCAGMKRQLRVRSTMGGHEWTRFQGGLRPR